MNSFMRCDRGRGSDGGTTQLGSMAHFSKMPIVVSTFCLRIHQNSTFHDRKFRNCALLLILHDLAPTLK